MSVIDYNEFVVVAEEEVIFYTDKNDAGFRFSIHLANMDWECTFCNRNRIGLECKDVTEGLVSEVLIEVLVYYREEEQTQFNRLGTNIQYPYRLHRGDKRWNHCGCRYPEFLLTLRVLKERSEFPTFIASDDVPANSNLMAKLKVSSKVFQVDKQLLSSVSPYFDRMFNGDFDDSKAVEIELKAEELTDADIFHDFLLTTLLSGDNNVFPNRQNVASLLKIARFCQVDILRKKCERHLKVCREMPLKDRILLCKEHRFNVVRRTMVREMSTKECKQLFNELLDEEKI